MSKRIVVLLVLSACGGTSGSSQPKISPTETGTTAVTVGETQGDVHRRHSGHAHQGHHKHSDAQPLVHRFEDAEKWAKRFDAPERDLWQRPAEVVQHMQISEGMTIVDIGAGTGYFLPYLSRATGAQGHVTGLDIEAGMVRYMTERAEREGWDNVSARICSTTDPGLPKGEVDRILIVDTWHHLPEREAYAQKLADSLSDSGTIAIVDFTMSSKRGPKKSHRIPAKQIVAELNRAGLKAEILEENLPDQFLVLARRH